MSVWNRADYLAASASLWRAFIQTIQGKSTGQTIPSIIYGLTTSTLSTRDYLGIHHAPVFRWLLYKPYLYFLEEVPTV